MLLCSNYLHAPNKLEHRDPTILPPNLLLRIFAVARAHRSDTA